MTLPSLIYYLLIKRKCQILPLLGFCSIMQNILSTGRVKEDIDDLNMIYR